MEKEIEIKYLNASVLKIFGKNFVNKNKDKIKINIDGIDRKLSEYLKLDKNDCKEISIKIIGINVIIDFGYMFYGCSKLIDVSDLSKIDTSNVTNLSYMFFS